MANSWLEDLHLRPIQNTEETIMRLKLFTRRRAVAVATVALAASGVSMSLAGTAGAVPSPSLLVGAGSNTTYQMMIGLGDLFNQSPGCDLAGGGAVGATLNCGTDPVNPDSNTPGEGGYPQASENPYDDYTVQAPAAGSGNGVNTLNQAVGGGNFTPNYARSSGAPSASNGTAADNYIAYAEDGVSWTAFSQQGEGSSAKVFPASFVNYINLTDLQDIWAGTLAGCTWDGKTLPEMSWGCLFPPASKKTPSAEVSDASDPIDCYVAQPGSGTAGTWAGYMGYNKKGPIGCLNEETAAVANGDTDATGTTGDHYNLFENEMYQVAENQGSGKSDDQANAIYFGSFGKLSTLCTAVVAKTVIPKDEQKINTDPLNDICPSTNVTSTGAKGTATSTQYITKMGGSFSANEASAAIFPDQTDIQGEGGGSYATGEEWPFNRYLYNVYDNGGGGGNGNTASEATLNLVGEQGFLCKSGTATDTDPLTGVNYRTEIEAVITENGFFPIDVSPSDTFSEGTPAVNIASTVTDANYSTVDPGYATEAGGSNTAPGYCLVFNG